MMDSNNYRVMDPQTFKITITRDAIVNKENRANSSIERSRCAIFLVDMQEDKQVKIETLTGWTSGIYIK